MITQFSGAVLDHTRSHRFLLWRFWDDQPRMLFVGLNPSTANELEDDPTIRRLCGFAKAWGFGGLFACNLFSYITAYPAELKDNVTHHPANTPAGILRDKMPHLIFLSTFSAYLTEYEEKIMGVNNKGDLQLLEKEITEK